MYTNGGRRKNLAAYGGEGAKESECYVFTSLRFDSDAKVNKLNPGCCKECGKCAYLFKYHYERLKEAAGNRMWFEAQERLKKPQDLYNRVCFAVKEYQEKNPTEKGPFKVRIMLRYHGNLEFDILPILLSCKQHLLYPPTFDLDPVPARAPASTRFEHFKVVLDALPSDKTLHTRFKTENRLCYDYSRRVAAIESFQDAKEVLLFNKDGQIMDGSIHTPYFLRNSKWVTPSDTCGGNKSTTRRWAVDQGLCSFGTININSLRDGEIIWLSNSVKGFFTARFIKDQGRCQGPNYRSASASTTSSGSVIATPCDSEPDIKAML